MRRHCLCSIPAGERPRPGGCGATRSMIAPGPAPRIRQQPTSTPRIAGASIRPRTWRHSEAHCRWMAMPGSAAWSRRARMPRSSWHSVGRTRGGRSTNLHLHPVAARGRGAGTHREALRDRGRHPRPAARCASGRSSAAKSAAGRGPAPLAAGPRAARAGLVGPGEGHAICTAPLGRADPVSQRRTSGDGHQCRRARHQTGDDGRVIVHPFFKCLETLEVCSCRQCDTGDLFGRLPP